MDTRRGSLRYVVLLCFDSCFTRTLDFGIESHSSPYYFFFVLVFLLIDNTNCYHISNILFFYYHIQYTYIYIHIHIYIYIVQCLIEEFQAGFLPIRDGTSLRSFLSKMLNCKPKRISKKVRVLLLLLLVVVVVTAFCCCCWWWWWWWWWWWSYRRNVGFEGLVKTLIIKLINALSTFFLNPFISSTFSVLLLLHTHTLSFTFIHFF